MACLACGAAARVASHAAREMMFGTRERFTYVECPVCASLQIDAPPADPARYYGDGYYSFARARRGIARYASARRTASAFGRGGWTGRAIARRFGVPADVRAVAAARLEGDHPRILDVGCGSGRLLVDLADAGFRHLVGLDPYIPRTLRHGAHVTVWRQTLAEHEGQYDLVMLHHSLEHMDDPRGALREARRLVAPDGQLLVRVPVAATHAWRTYGVDWVQLDAPRHVLIPSRDGFDRLAAASGFVVERVVYDSTAFQFWASELYRRDIPLVDATSRRAAPRGPAAASLEPGALAALESRATRLNACGDGDQACFYLRPRDDRPKL